MLRARVGPTLRVVASLALLWLAWRLAGGERLLASLRAVHAPWLLAAVALTVPMQLLSAARWRYTCARLRLALPLRRAVGDYYLASLMNMVLPGGVTGDVARVWRHGTSGTGDDRQSRPDAGRFRRPLHAVVLERAAGQAALLAVLAVAVVVNAHRHPWLAPAALAVAGMLALVSATAWLLARGRPAGGALAELLADARAAFLPLPVLAHQSLLSLAVVATYLLAFWCATEAVRAPLDPALALLAVPLVLTAMTLPVSVGGLGLREASAAGLWPLLGLAAGDGAAAALCYGFAMLLGSLPGAAVLLASARSR